MMSQIIFLTISFLIYFGAFSVAKLLFGDGDLAILVGAIAGGICFWWLALRAKKLED
jgi:hypothetical protein